MKLSQRLLRLTGLRRSDRFELSALTRPTRVANMRAIRALCQNAYLGGGEGLCRVLGRFKMFVDTRDVGVSSHLMLDGYWEMWVTEFFIERIRHGMVAVDVGANLGYFTLIMADLTGPTGRVYAFEPNPVMAERVRRSAHVNGFLDKIVIHADPLGDVEGVAMTLLVPEYYPGGAAIVPAAPDTPEASVLIQRRLDSFAELSDADFIKIDAEGSEWAIWQGMSGIFARGRPMTVVLEFMALRYADPAAFLAAILEEGFAIHHISAATPFQPITPDEILRLPGGEDAMLVLTR